MSSAKQKADISAEAATKFVGEFFYRIFDTSRHDLRTFYVDQSTMLWNGNARKGGNDIHQFYLNLPPTQHQCLSLDSQPAPDGPGMTTSVLVTVCGNVIYGNDPPRSFTQAFLLVQEAGGPFHVLNDCFRLLPTTVAHH